MSDFLAVLGCTLDHGLGSIISGGVFTVTAVPDTKVFQNSLGVYFTSLAFTFSGGNASGCDPGTVTGGGSIIASSTKVTKGGFVMRENDETTTGPFVGTISGTPVPLGIMPVKISSAGQSKVRSD